MSASNDGSESVDQFLARIASVKEGRDKDGEARTRRMEEDFLKNRKERQARRLERARSISPSKTGPSRPISVFGSPAPPRDTILNPPVDFSPQAASLTRSNAVNLKISPKLEAQRTEPEPASSPLPASSPPTTSSLARSGTLSWQQRPSREAGLGRPRPLSSIATVRPIQHEDVKQPRSPKELTNQEIAASLSTKDPTWFRQTQDRGASSAAYRKNQVEDTPDIDPKTRSMKLHGLSHIGSAIGEHDQAEVRTHDTSVLTRSAFGASTEQLQLLRSSESPKATGSPLQDKARDPESDVNFGRSTTMVPSMARSPSPTKGLGGFVQSAMMKRSDSVSKRWSVQAHAGLKRGDSVAGTRPLSGLGTPAKSIASQDLSGARVMSSSPSSTSRPESRSASRPGSSNGGDTTAPILRDDRPVKSQPQPAAKTVQTSERPATPTNDNDLSRSPSKTTDPRRWSPTKSSWLESTLLAKTEPPKIIPKKEEQPQWMVNLQRTKSTRDKAPEKRQVQTEDKKPIDLGSGVRVSSVGKPKKEPPSRKDQKSTQEVSVPDDESIEKLESMETTARDIPADSKPLPQEQSGKPDNENPAADSGIGLQQRPNVEKQPPVLKPKPQTSPKTDFRATLRPRAPTSEAKAGTEPEFRSMFGKLKATQTKNYVAPDTLKDNILSGKAGLNVTNGPQKTKRVDEFKESILQKKDAMKTSALEKKQNPSSTEQAKPEQELPEALRRRNTLHKATASVTRLQDNSATVQSTSQDRQKLTPALKPKAQVLKEPTTLSTKPEHTASPQPPTPARPKTLPNVGSVQELSSQTKTDDKTASTPPKPKPKPASAIAIRTSQQDAPKTNVIGNRDSRPTPSTTHEQAHKAAPSLPSPGSNSLPTNGKLASRLNPNLAAMLSRGQNPRPPLNQSTSSDDLPQIVGARSVEISTREEASSNELTHMTKGRAKGPKRRAPKTQPQSSVAASDTPTKQQSRVSTPRKQAVSIKGADDVAEVSASSVSDLGKSTPLKKSDLGFRQTNPDSKSEKETVLPKSSIEIIPSRAKPTIHAKSPDLRRVSSLSTSTTEKETKPDSPALKVTETASAAVETIKPAVKSAPAPQNMTSKPTMSVQPLTPSKTRVNAPKQPPSNSAPPPKPSSPKPTSGLGVAKSVIQRVPSPMALSQSAPTKDAGSRSATQSTVDVSSIVKNYFVTVPSSKDKVEFDTSALLAKAKDEPEKIKTISNTIWELTSGGRKSAMPAQQEHILYEDSMYLMLHVFEGSSGKTSNVFLWCGDRVPEAAIEDVQIFCKKDAREQGAKLEVVRQGKEPASFFQALGGIVITRRSKSSALYMLCGRKHLGHIAFDEVDLDPSRLCTGFPYLISAKFGSLFLWKGKGSAIDEVGCARLIGMDLGLTGEIEEIDEGEEPSSFWKAFPDSMAKPTDKLWATEWEQRADHWGYPGVLYRMEQERPKSSGGFWGLRPTSPSKPTGRAAVEPIIPHSQRDLEAGNVYIFDAYHSVYVLLPNSSSHKTTEIITALHLAQEIALLSPSIQNRRLQPSCYVVFGDSPPRDVKACFRKWTDDINSQDDATTTTTTTTTVVRLEDVMQALGL